MLTVYSKVNCPYCEAIEKLFKMKEFDYNKLTLNQHFTQDEFVKLFGKDATFPQVLDDSGNPIGGATETVVYLKVRGLV